MKKNTKSEQGNAEKTKNVPKLPSRTSANGQRQPWPGNSIRSGDHKWHGSRGPPWCRQQSASHAQQANPRHTNKKCESKSSPTHGLSCTPQHQRRIATTSASGVPPLTAGIPIHTYVYHLRSTGRALSVREGRRSCLHASSFDLTFDFLLMTYDRYVHVRRAGSRVERRLAVSQSLMRNVKKTCT